MILYINNEHCSSVEQLKGYFTEDITPESDTYADLLDYGRHGDIAEWLREMGESDMASRVESISGDLVNSAFYDQLKAVITGTEVKDIESLKPKFDKCFAFEGVKCDVKDNEAKVTVNLKVLMSVNEKYELCVSSNWGTRAAMVNPYDFTEGKTAPIDFILRKRPGKEIGEIVVKAERKELSSMKIQTVADIEDFNVGGITFKMIRVEGGSFRMGTKDDNYQVTLTRNYHIGETQVTQALWKAVMGSNPSHFKGDTLPVESVSWNDCQEFIRLLNKITNKQFRLPTDAEWEFAARGGKKGKNYCTPISATATKAQAESFLDGFARLRYSLHPTLDYKVKDLYSGSNNLDEVAWYCDNSSHKTHPVKTKKSNELGIYDMSGNVFEWCQDWFGSFNKEIQTDPVGPDCGSRRVGRGGSWNYEAGYCQVSSRDGFHPAYVDSFIGLRLALSE